MRVKIGATTRTQPSGFVVIDAEKSIKHEKFVPFPMLKNDIGLIKMKAGISSFGEFIKYSSIRQLLVNFNPPLFTFIILKL